MAERLLLADDDQELAALLREYLEREGFQVAWAKDGHAALEKCRSQSFALMILDVMMPKMSGTEVLRELRKHSQMPVLMLTARGQDMDRIIGLELGADDYLPKPANPRELLARIKAILRRTQDTSNTAGQPDAGQQVSVHQGDIELNAASREAFLNGQQISLTSTEYSVLQKLLEHAGQVVHKSDLYLFALGREPMRYDRTIDMHVSNLRRKLGPDADGNNRIETIRGLGYQYLIRQV